MQQHKTSTNRHPLSLVVETDDPVLAISDFVAFADAGFDVVVCSGRTDQCPCPATDGDSCEVVAGADVVLNAFRDPVLRAIVLDGVRSTSPDVAVVVATHDDEELPDGCVPMRDTVSIPGQTAILRRAALS